MFHLLVCVCMHKMFSKKNLANLYIGISPLCPVWGYISRYREKNLFCKVKTLFSPLILQFPEFLLPACMYASTVTAYSPHCRNISLMENKGKQTAEGWTKPNEISRQLRLCTILQFLHISFDNIMISPDVCPVDIVLNSQLYL